MTKTLRSWALTAIAAVVLAGGCGVSADLAARIDAANTAALNAAREAVTLAEHLAKLAADFKGGRLDQLTYAQLRDETTAKWTAAREMAVDAKLKALELDAQAKAEGAGRWSVAGAVALNLLLRLLGIPGFASGSGGNLVSLSRHLAGKDGDK